MLSSDLKQIKKHYGEKMSHLCRDLFPQLLETEKLFTILSNTFHFNRDLYNDLIEQNKINDFKNYIMSLSTYEEDNNITTKTVSQLMNEAEYTLYECKTNEDVNNFKKYYKNGEVLCTFNDISNRLKNYHVFFAVKNDVENIKRSDKPRREDDYGISVISIQIHKENNWLSIKNRYNHAVNNPDATYSNNLDNIIQGLTDAFNKKYGLKINKSQKTSFELNSYIKASNKYYKYNMEINNIYYCWDNIVIRNGNVEQYDKSQYKIIDYFVLDKKNKTLKLIDTNINDCFVDININKIVEVDNKIIINDDIVITLNNSNSIIGYKNLNVTTIGNYFLCNNEQLSNIELFNVTAIGNGFLYNNKQLNNIELFNVTTIGNDFLCNNEQLNNIELFNVTTIGNDFLCNNEQLNNIELPNVTTIGNYFLCNNEQLSNIELFNVTAIGNGFLYNNKQLNNIELPNVTTIGNDFLYNNKQLNNIELFNVTTIGNDFLCNNKQLNSIELPNVTTIGNSFLYNNKQLNNIELPNVTTIGNYFLCNNEQLSNIELPNVTTIGNSFLYNNKQLSSIELPNVTAIGYNFLYNNKQLSNIELPNVTTIGNSFLYNNKQLSSKFVKVNN